MTSLVNDCGPIYGKVFRYDIHAIAPITFTWPIEDSEDEYYSIYREDDVVDRHTPRIKIKKSITLANFFDIVERMTPHIVFIFAKFMHCGRGDDGGTVTTRKPNNSISTLIYGGNDLNLEQINQWFPSLKYLYVYKLKKTTKSSEIITMSKLETLSCWYCDHEIFKALNLPNLENLDVYRFTSIMPPPLSSSCSSSSSSNKIIERFPRLTSLRIDARQMTDVLPAFRLRLLQYYRVASDERAPSSDNLLAQIAKSNAVDLIVPPGLTAAYISSLHNRMQDTTLSNRELRLGVYVDDANLFEYTRHFENMQIFDSVQPLKVASVRQAGPLHLHLPKEINRNILTHMRHLNGGTEHHHKFLLSNFNIFMDHHPNASHWINLYKSERFVYICALEIVLDDEEKWPSIVKTTKNRVFVINAQRTDVFLDVNAKPMFIIAEFLLKIHKWVKFTNVHLLTRGDDRTQNENYADALQKELSRDANINVYKYSAPATIIVA